MQRKGQCGDDFEAGGMKDEKPEFVIRSAQREGDHELLMIMARSAVDEAQGPHATRRIGSDLPPSGV